MVGKIGERLQWLRDAIEELRAELHTAIARDDGRLDGAETYRISENLDRLVAQYLRIKEKIDGRDVQELGGRCTEEVAAATECGEYLACHHDKLTPKSSVSEEAVQVASVIGTFDSRDKAERAVQELKQKGFGDDKVSIVAKEDRMKGGDRGEGGLTMRGGGDDLTGGTLTGGAIGGAAGILAGLGALAIPGIGPIVAAGPIAAGLTGAVTGGIVGGLVDLGIPEERGRYYESKVKEGKILAVVKADDNTVDDAKNVLAKFGASDIEIH
ncbi:MAG TPA: Spo0E family sporulation regulatory protein-aspartic acid phosphatase [Firmicutes bacterium]|nr:Spo0E family sporulation regulatory protein-aspartic acid phosphatase [Bacillota bacterium]